MNGCIYYMYYSYDFYDSYDYEDLGDKEPGQVKSHIFQLHVFVVPIPPICRIIIIIIIIKQLWQNQMIRILYKNSLSTSAPYFWKYFIVFGLDMTLILFSKSDLKQCKNHMFPPLQPFAFIHCWDLFIDAANQVWL